jgi:transcription initiation factor IIE alpha subunit
MIRDYIIEKGEAYPKQIHKHLADTIGKMGYHAPSYESVRKFMYILEELGLIIFVREEPAPTRPRSKALPRRYYRVSPDEVDDQAWLNPYARLYHKMHNSIC